MPASVSRTVTGSIAAASTMALILTGTVALSTSNAVTARNPAHLAQESSPTDRSAVAVGRGGAVSSVDPNATSIGISVLKRGGTAADAAVATAAALGVAEPYSAGIGGGGFFVYYDAAKGKVSTIDGRETAPMSISENAFIDPATGLPYPFTPQLVTSGVSVGVPGTPATWNTALRRWGTLSLGKALRPATRLADHGFVVDQTFYDQTAANAVRFAAIAPTADLFLPGGSPPAVGTTFRNPDLADTYRLLARHGVSPIYHGRLGREIVEVVQNPPKVEGTTLPVPEGSMEPSDLADYEAKIRKPTHSTYRGLDIYGMGPPSSGGTTIGEALNILERVRDRSDSPVDVLHKYLESSALAYADRAANLGDPDFVDVPVDELLSRGFAAERACNVDPDHAATKPVPAGSPDGDYELTCGATAAGAVADDHEGLSTTHVTVVDRWGNIASYTLTIEQTGGSAITVPGRGFLLNNELTDFSAKYVDTDPNRIQPGKRPRSSMSPTIVMRHGRPWLALGSPGGSTIITTVLQTLVNRIDLRMNLLDAVAAPRAQQANSVTTNAEQAFIDKYGAELVARGHAFGPPTEIGAATAVEFLRGGRLLAVAEPVRRGGGDAQVVWGR